MRHDSVMLFTTAASGGLLGLLAMLAELDELAALLCSVVFAIAAACLFTGFRFYARSAIVPLPQARPAHERDSVTE